MVILLRYDQYLIASDAILLLTAIATIILAHCTWTLVRRRHDPARSWTTYLKMAFTFFSAYVTLGFCSYALSLTYSLILHEKHYKYIRYILSARAHVSAVDSLLGSLASIFIFLTFVNLAIDIGVVHTGKPGTVDKALKIVSFAMAALILVLSMVTFAISEYIYSEYYGSAMYLALGDEFSSQFINLWNSERQIDFSLVVLLFVLAVATMIWSVVVKIQTRLEQRVQTATTFLIICCAFWLLKTTFDLAYFIKYVNLKDVTDDPKFDDYMVLLYIIIGTLPVFILLCMLFSLGIKRNGVWSFEPQSSPTQSGGQGVPERAWSYPHYPTQDQMVQTQQQQQQLVQPNWQHQPLGMQPAYFYPAQQQYAQHQQESGPYEMPHETRDVIQPASPPPHHETMGLNHQANGTPPQAPTAPYDEKR